METGVDGFAYDVFLLYHPQNKPVASRLAQRLRGAGVRVWFDDWEINAGDNIRERIDQGLRLSRTLILCLSKSATDPSWNELERATTLFRSLNDEGRRIVPVLLQACELPDTLRQLQPIDFEADSPASFEALLGACRANRNPSVPAQGDASSGSIWTFALLAFVSFLCGIAVLLLLVFKGDWAVKLGLEGRLFYVTLLPLGLSAAVFLFGVVRSYAAYTGQVYGGTLELGGPIVAFVLVVIGGFELVPNPSPFSVTAFVHGEAGSHDLVLRDSGWVSMDLGQDRKRERIGDKGEARFQSILPSFRGQTVPVDVDAPGYELVGEKSRELTEAPMYLKVRPALVKLGIQVRDAKGPVEGAVVSLPDLNQSTTTGPTGRATFSLRGLPGDKVNVTVGGLPRYAPESDIGILGSGDLVMTLRKAR